MPSAESADVTQQEAMGVTKNPAVDTYHRERGLGRLGKRYGAGWPRTPTVDQGIHG